MTIEPTPTPQSNVAWGAVIGGVFAALGAGVIIVFGSFIAGLALADAIKPPTLAAAIAALLPAAIYTPVYLMLRRRAPDFCKGLLVGACVVVIVGGLCNAMGVASIATNGFH